MNTLNGAKECDIVGKGEVPWKRKNSNLRLSNYMKMKQKTPAIIALPVGVMVGRGWRYIVKIYRRIKII